MSSTSNLPLKKRDQSKIGRKSTAKSRPDSRPTSPRRYNTGSGTSRQKNKTMGNKNTINRDNEASVAKSISILSFEEIDSIRKDHNAALQAGSSTLLKTTMAKTSAYSAKRLESSNMNTFRNSSHQAADLTSSNKKAPDLEKPKQDFDEKEIEDTFEFEISPLKMQEAVSPEASQLQEFQMFEEQVGREIEDQKLKEAVSILTSPKITPIISPIISPTGSPSTSPKRKVKKVPHYMLPMFDHHCHAHHGTGSKEGSTSRSPARKDYKESDWRCKIECDKLKSQVQSLQNQLKKQDDAEEEIANLRKKLKEYEESLQKERQEKLQLQCQVSDLQSENESLKLKMNSLEQTIRMQDGQLKERDTEIKKLEDTRAQMKKTIEELSKNLQERDNELYEAKKLLPRLVELEQQNQDLQRLYIPHKDDKIDEALANYIQQFPEKEKMKIMFLRESEGVYQFGQRRVYLKIEKGNTIKVRVGGGFMPIDQFINQFSDSEVQRIERRDVMARFQNKKQMQKISVEKCNSSLELSPIRSPQRPVTKPMLNRLKSPVRFTKPVHISLITSPMNKTQSSTRISGLRASKKTE